MVDGVVHPLDPLGSPEEIPCVLRLLSEREAAGAMSVAEADSWRFYLAAWYGYHSLNYAGLAPRWKSFWTTLASTAPTLGTINLLVDDSGGAEPPVVETATMDEVLWSLDPDELPGALRLLVAMEKAGWVSPTEAEEWRGHIAALRVFHEDPNLWIDGPEA